ncbi:MAG: hypothetical protein ABTQ32_23930 [Myxococcaceae bacterium]
MRTNMLCTLLVAVVVVCGCKRSEPQPSSSQKLDVRREFEAELRRRQFEFTRAPDGRYEVRSAALSVSDFTLTVSIENLTREVERDHDLGAIARFVDRFEQLPEAETWDAARPRLRLSLEPNDYDASTMSGALYRPTSETTMQVLTRITKTGDVHWVTNEELKSWGVTREQAETIAKDNLDALLVGTEPEVQQIGMRKIGMLPIVESASKASVILAPNFRRFIEPNFGWPVLAVTPCRDFVYVFGKDDFDLVGKSGKVVLEEFNRSDHPITTEVWKISDAGVESIGALGDRNPYKR